MTFREILIEKGISQTAVAKKLKKSPQLVNSWIKGKCQPQLSDIPSLSTFLNISQNELIECFAKKTNKKGGR